MKKRPTITIGIPAYNEARNIVSLLADLIHNKQRTYRREKIIVVSDGSTDDTVALVKKFGKFGVEIIHSQERRGQAHAQNQIIRRTTSDYLILLNADVKVTDPNFIDTMLKPFHTSPNVGLVSARVIPLPASTYIEKVINWSHDVKTKMYEMNPDSLYLCHGRARAFSQKLYTKLAFPKIIAEDAYSYLFAKESGLRFAYAKKARVYFRSPTTLRDHLLQSQRFMRGKQELEAYFPPSTLRDAYRLPKQSITLWRTAILRQPMYALTYFFILFISAITKEAHKQYTHAVWRPSESSKNL